MKINIREVFVTDVGEFPVSDAPQVWRLYKRAIKRLDGQPDRRYKSSRAYWAAFQEFSDKKLQEYISGAELSVIYGTNNSQVRLYGADNPDALRGIYLDGVVLDEYADMDPRLWPEVIRPVLADRGGWAVMIGTPRGHNAFYREVSREYNQADKGTGILRLRKPRKRK